MSGISTACSMLVATMALQQDGGATGAPNVAVINLAAVFERYEMTRDLESMFAERRQSLTTEGERRRDDISVQHNALSQFKPDSKDYLDRKEKVMRSEIDFRIWLEIQELKLKDEHKSWLKTIYHSVQTTVAELAGRRGIDLVLTYSDLDDDVPDSAAFKQQIMLRTVLFATDRVDLTTPTLEMLDAAYGKRGGAATLNKRNPSGGAP